MNKRLFERFGTEDVATILKRVETDGFTSEFSFEVTKKAFNKGHIEALCKSRGVDYQDGYENRAVEGIISTEVVDRHGDIVLAEGIDFTDFRTNPVIFFNHETHALPVAVSLNEEVFAQGGKKGVKATVLFHEVTELSNALCKMYKQGLMKGFSVGMRPKPGGAKFPSPEERRALGMREVGLVYTATNLWEFSAVGIPANQEAVTVAKGLLTKNERVALLGEQPEQTTQEYEMNITEEQLKALIAEVVETKMAPTETVDKAGRRYSKVTKERITSAFNTLKQMMDDMEGDEEDEEEEDVSKSMASVHEALSSVNKKLSTLTESEDA